MFFLLRRICLLAAGMLVAIIVMAQRVYLPHSVLASGNWYKIAVQAEGVYKIDVPFLNALGILGNIPSAGIRLYGNGGAMLPEANGTPRIDDLAENAIAIFDGGDGI